MNLEVHLKNVACFKDQIFMIPLETGFYSAANGVGKSTLFKAIKTVFNPIRGLNTFVTDSEKSLEIVATIEDNISVLRSSPVYTLTNSTIPSYLFMDYSLLDMSGKVELSELVSDMLPEASKSFGVIKQKKQELKAVKQQLESERLELYKYPVVVLEGEEVDGSFEGVLSSLLTLEGKTLQKVATLERQLMILQGSHCPVCKKPLDGLLDGVKASTSNTLVDELQKAKDRLLELKPRIIRASDKLQERFNSISLRDSQLKREEVESRIRTLQDKMEKLEAKIADVTLAFFTDTSEILQTVKYIVLEGLREIFHKSRIPSIEISHGKALNVSVYSINGEISSTTLSSGERKVVDVLLLVAILTVLENRELLVIDKVPFVMIDNLDSVSSSRDYDWGNLGRLEKYLKSFSFPVIGFTASPTEHSFESLL